MAMSQFFLIALLIAFANYGIKKSFRPAQADFNLKPSIPVLKIPAIFYFKFSYPGVTSSWL